MIEADRLLDLESPHDAQRGHVGRAA